MNRWRTWVAVSLGTRVAVLAAVLLGALWPTYLNLRYAYDNARIVGLSEGAAWEHFYRGIRAVDSLFGTDDLLPRTIFGGAPAPTLLGIPAFDPVVAPSVLLQSPGALESMWPGLLVVLLLTLLIGRGPCAFLCPASLFFSSIMRLRELAEHRFPWLRDQRRELPRGARFGILVGGTVAALLFGAWVWRLLLPYALVSGEMVQLAVGGSLTVATGALVFVLLAELTLFPGEVCRSLCPLGFILGRTSRLALVTVRANTAAPCPTGCESCAEVCDLQLDPRDGVVADCSLCGRCLTHCPASRLRIGVRGLSMVVLALVLVPAVAEAHHYKGLPHYGYFDHYPQTPTDEFIATDGPWEMHFTIYNFQGMQRADVDAPDDVQLFLVIYDLRRQKPYGGSADIEIHSGDSAMARWRMEPEQESVFYIHTQVAPPDDLSLQVRFTGPDGKEVFLVSTFELPGEGGRNPLVWVGLGLVGLLGLMFLASKQTRPRRRRDQQEASS